MIQKMWMCIFTHPHFPIYQIIYNYLTSSKINTIVYQIDKYLMVQIWSLKFIKSILDVIIDDYSLFFSNHLFLYFYNFWLLEFAS